MVQKCVNTSLAQGTLISVDIYFSILDLIMDGSVSSINAILPQATLATVTSVGAGVSSATGMAGADFLEVLNAGSVEGFAEASSETSKAEDLRAEKVKMEFEAVILSQFIGEMLDSTSEVFGDGMQGDLINTVLKDAISKQIAQSGGLGIKKML